MTRPAQPQEYGSGRKTPQPVEYGRARPPASFQKSYRHPITNRPYEGEVSIFRDGTRLMAVGLVDGLLRVDLPRGVYHLTAAVLVDGRVRYLDEDVAL